MIALIQRVSQARVDVEGQSVGAVGRGLLALIGVRDTDSEPNAIRLAERIVGYRVFPDAAVRMNLSVADVGGGILLVPQFTLAADTGRGMRASFSGAAEPTLAVALFEHLVDAVRARHATVATGVFGADMKVSLVNDGPVTFWLEG